MADITPPDYTSPVGIVRNLIGDTVQRTDPKFPGDPAEYMFSDDQLNAFVVNSQGTGTKPRTKFAAADAMDVIASNEALVSKKIRTQDLQTDGPAVANALRIQSQNLRAQQKLELEEDWAVDAVQLVDYQKEPSLLDLLEFRPYWDPAL
jgi:hypothetical protein